MKNISITRQVFSPRRQAGPGGATSEVGGPDQARPTPTGNVRTGSRRLRRAAAAFAVVAASTVAGQGLLPQVASASRCGPTGADGGENFCPAYLSYISSKGNCTNGNVCLKVGTKIWNYDTYKGSSNWSGTSTPPGKGIRNRQSGTKRPVCGYQYTNTGGKYTYKTYSYSGYFSPSGFTSFESFMAIPYGMSASMGC